MKLSEWRTANKTSLIRMADLIGIKGSNPGRNLHRYETGENPTPAPVVQAVYEMTSGQVTAQDMHETRLAWLAAQNAKSKSDCTPLRGRASLQGKRQPVNGRPQPAGGNNKAGQQ